MLRGVRWISDRITEEGDRNPGRRPRLLLLCDYRPHEASTVLDHIEAIRKWSRNDVFVLPILGDLPDDLDLDAFDGLVIHYNVVMSVGTYLSPLARWRISRFRGVKAAFIQDEYRFVNSTIGVMRTLGIHVLFTCVPEDQVDLVYPVEALPELRRKVTVLTGYVPHELLSLPVLPYADRTVDVGYRGRRLPPWLGSLAREKVVIAERFAADATAFGLTTNISCEEDARLYGQAWIDFTRQSRATLGVESGASVFDFDGSVEQAIRRYLSAHPDAPFEELHRLFLAEVDGRIRLNQISPRCFEAAALGTLMVLYPGDYSGILKPWRHYLPLQKDHSNMTEVAQAIRDRETWERITTRAREEVALNPAYSFRAMVATVDKALGLATTATAPIRPDVFERMASGSFRGMRTTQLRAFGLPPAVNRARLIAGRAARKLRPSPTAISVSPRSVTGWVRSLREFTRQILSLIYWVLRPGALPSGLLVAHRTALLRDLSGLGRLQAAGARARAVGVGSPFALLLAEDARELQVVLRSDGLSSGSPLPDIPRDLSWASQITFDLSDTWLLPAGVDDHPVRRLGALSAVLRARPDVARGLLAGRSPWCDVFLRRTLSDA